MFVLIWHKVNIDIFGVFLLNTVALYFQVVCSSKIPFMTSLLQKL